MEHQNVFDSQCCYLEGLQIRNGTVTFERSSWLPYLRKVSHIDDMQGIEDVRVIAMRDKLLYTGTSKEVFPNTHNYAPVIGKIDNGFLNVPMTLFRPRMNVTEKNWLHWVTDDGELLMIPSFDPFTVVVCNPQSGVCSPRIPPQVYPGLQKLRGSCSPIRLDSSRVLLLAHETHYLHLSRNYYHRFVVCRLPEWTIESVSLPFTFTKKHMIDGHIEFCLGMVGKYDGSGTLQSVLVAPTFQDENPTVLEILWASILNILIPLPISSSESTHRVK
jgi:hypothetical protein